MVCVVMRCGNKDGRFTDSEALVRWAWRRLAVDGAEDDPVGTLEPAHGLQSLWAGLGADGEVAGVDGDRNVKGEDLDGGWPTVVEGAASSRTTKHQDQAQDQFQARDLMDTSRIAHEISEAQMANPVESDLPDSMRGALDDADTSEVAATV